MVVQEMQYEFQRLLETVDPRFITKDKPDTDVILLNLNIAQTRFIFDKYLNKGTISDTLAYIRKKSDDLRNLIQPSEPLNITPITTGPYSYINSATGSGSPIGYIAPISGLSTLYMFYLRSDSYIQRVTSLPTSGYIWTPNEIADSYADLEKVTTNLYNVPILRQPVVSLLYAGSGNTSGIRILVDQYTVINSTKGFWIEYLRQPKYLTLGTPIAQSPTYVGTTSVCELALHTHEEITRFAVDIFLNEYKLKLTSKEDNKVQVSKEE